LGLNASLFDLSGRTALITGGGSGLGYAIARALAAAGAKVVLLGRNADNLRRGEAEIAAAGGRTAHVVCDLADGDRIRPTVEQAQREHGAIDVLVNNAGIQQRAPLTEFPKEGWDRMIAVHLSAPFLLAQAVAAGMIARRRGKIINVASIMSELARPTIIPYAAAKGGLKMLTRGLAVELGAHNIQVNAIAPGFFRTAMNTALMDNPEFDAWVKRRTPAARWGEPDELAGIALLLASSASDYINGQIIFIDGGLTAAV
jgi:gluconate 5-dehydrogenase